MTDTLTPETESRIAAKVAEGSYASSDEVVDKALALLDAYEQEQAEKRDRLRNAIQEGIDSGPPEPMDWDAFWLAAEQRVADGKQSRVAGG